MRTLSKADISEVREARKLITQYKISVKRLAESRKDYANQLVFLHNRFGDLLAFTPYESAKIQRVAIHYHLRVKKWAAI